MNNSFLKNPKNILSIRKTGKCSFSFEPKKIWLDNPIYCNVFTNRILRNSNSKNWAGPHDIVNRRRGSMWKRWNQIETDWVPWRYSIENTGWNCAQAFVLHEILDFFGECSFTHVSVLLWKPPMLAGQYYDDVLMLSNWRRRNDLTICLLYGWDFVMDVDIVCMSQWVIHRYLYIYTVLWKYIDRIQLQDTNE